MQHLLHGLSGKVRFLHGLQVAGENCCSYSLIPEVGVAHCHWRYLNKNHLQPHSPKGHHRGGHCDLTPSVGALVPPGTHPPCCYHCQTFQAVPTRLVSVTSQDPAARSSRYSTSCGLSETGCFIHGLQVVGENHCSYH